MDRIGAYGGTFDPIHNAHLEVAKAVVRGFALDRLLLVPARVPPHKEPERITDSHHRYAMAVIATLDEPAISVSTVEVENPRRPYSFETIERLRERYGPGAALFFLMGADSFQDLSTWRNPERLLAGANVIVVSRPGHILDAPSLPERFRSAIRDLRGKACNGSVGLDGAVSGLIYLTDCVNNNISSTSIRRQVRDGESIAGSVPSRVAEYIRKYELYRR